jgi:hypothetical protein
MGHTKKKWLIKSWNPNLADKTITAEKYSKEGKGNRPLLPGCDVHGTVGQFGGDGRRAVSRGMKVLDLGLFGRRAAFSPIKWHNPCSYIIYLQYIKKKILLNFFFIFN